MIIFNLPNILTIARIFLSVFFIFALLHKDPFYTILSVILFSVAAFTDFLDGFIARRYNLVTNFGKFMDPLADKILVLSAFFVFAYQHVISIWVFVIVFAREAIVTLARLHALKFSHIIAADRFGKIKTFSQMILIGVVLFWFVIDRGVFTGLLGSDGNLNILLREFVALFSIAVAAITAISGISFVISNRMMRYRA